MRFLKKRIVVVGGIVGAFVFAVGALLSLYTCLNSNQNAYAASNKSKQYISVKKVWEDDKKEDRPSSIEVSLLCGNTVLETVNMSEANNSAGDNTWEYVFRNHPVDGCRAGYHVAENRNIPGYTSKITGSAKDGFVITNTKNLDTIITWGSASVSGLGAIALGFFFLRRRLY